jgi:hypothetical protein
MALLGFIGMFFVLCYFTFVALAMVFGSLAYSGTWKKESTVGMITLLLMLICWYKLCKSAPFAITLL